MNTQRLPSRIPQELRRYFWDVKVEALDPAKHPHYVINRLLDKGGLDAARWVLKSFPKETVINSLRHGPAVDPPTASFWSNYLKISRKDIVTNNDYRRKPDPKLWPFGELN